MSVRYGIGIDAGGTYTDAALLDLTTGQVVVFTKSLTTRPDPSEGIRMALSKVNQEFFPSVSMVSLATTFATNAIVEGRGTDAGLILIGYEEIPADITETTRVLRVEGGHTVSGDEKAPLDLTSLEENLPSFLRGLEAVAIAGFFSVRNSDHEHQVARMIRERYDVSVVLGHQLSMRLDAMKRATTAWWNARLIPLIRNLIRATENVLSEMGISAPLMIVKGDGTLMSVDNSLDRPIDTILSGPAASILGAKFLASTENALIVDMGGTTTDMALLVGGKVAINPNGAQVGKWRTHVEAAKVRTTGLGGDSLISIDEEGNLAIGPRRVVPLCLMAERHPEVIDLLKQVLQRIKGYGRRGINPSSIYVQGNSASKLVSEFLLFEDPERWPSILAIRQAEGNGSLYRSALTPTDIRVASGRFPFGRQEASALGLAVYSKFTDMDLSSFEEAVEKEICRRLCLEAVCFIGDTDPESLRWVTGQWFRKASNSNSGVGLDVGISMTAPVIGAGAPAAAYLPQAFQKLNTECILPEAHSVACAIGAVVGVVSFHLAGEIRPTPSGKYSLHTPHGKEVLETLDQAIQRGEAVLASLARDRMKKNHVSDPLMQFSMDEKRVRTSSGQEVYLETTLRLEATGRPTVEKPERKMD